MLKKEITYTNPFTKESVTETHYFHISKADLVEMEMEEHTETYVKDGETLTGMQAKLQKIVDSQDGKAIMVEFKDIIRRSYGKKDGDRFLKSPEIWEDFRATEAFSQLFFEICTDADVASEFVNGIIPDNLDQIANEVRAQAELEERDTLTRDDMTSRPMPSETSSDSSQESKLLTRKDLTELTNVEIQQGLDSGRYRLA